jgi:uncharacterized membrane protein YdjX (TVP38/TMEM64 family)
LSQTERELEAKAEERRRQLTRTLVAMVLLALFFLATSKARGELGLELSTDSIRAAVERFGWWAPAGYLALVTVRQFLMLPSVLVLGAAGLLFGAAEGALLGGVGITLNALLMFGIARSMGADWVRDRLHRRFPNFEERARAAGPLFVAIATAHPMGPQTAFHFGAGVTPISWWVFAAVVLPAALFRAGCYAYLGANILEPANPRFWLASIAVFAISVSPLAHPGLRARLFGRTPSPDESGEGADDDVLGPPDEGRGDEAISPRR